MRKAIVKRKTKKTKVTKRSQPQTNKTQSQTQRQVVNVILEKQSQRVRQPKTQSQPSTYQTFFIERSPSQQVISNDPFRTGVIQQNKETNTTQTGGLETNVEGLSRLAPAIAKEDFTKPQLTISNVSQTNIPSQSTFLEGQFSNVGLVDFTTQKKKRQPVTPGSKLGRPIGSKNKVKSQTGEM